MTATAAPIVEKGTLYLEFFAGGLSARDFEVMIPEGYIARVLRVEDKPDQEQLIFARLVGKEAIVCHGVLVTLDPNSRTYWVSHSRGLEPKLICCEGVTTQKAELKRGISLLVWQNGPHIVQGVNVY